ncbi:MAG: hypothetical protein J5379_00065 [Clostridiales bacterium]|nr:hypothetical protein [Clostridiales bacterium]
MDTDRRLQMIRILEEADRFPDFSEKIGLTDISTFHGEKIKKDRNGSSPNI